MTNEDKVREIISEIAEAVRAKDIERLMTYYADWVLSFDVVNPLLYSGADELKARMEQWFNSFEGPIGFENRDLKIVVGDITAFCHSLNHVDGTKMDGGKLEMWWRATLGFEKINGRWSVTHVHSSVPFDTETGLASLGLKP